MPFHLDENLSYRAAVIARGWGLDVSSSYERGWNGRSDEEQLRLAAAEGRCVVTRDYGDFHRATERLRLAGQRHAGVVCAPPGLLYRPPVVLARALLAYAELHPDGVPPYTIDWLFPARDA